MIVPSVTLGFVIAPVLAMLPPVRFAIEHEYVNNDPLVVVLVVALVVVVVVNAGCANK